MREFRFYTQQMSSPSPPEIQSPTKSESRNTALDIISSEYFPKPPLQFEESYIREKAEKLCTFTKSVQTPFSRLDTEAKKASIPFGWRLGFYIIAAIGVGVLIFIFPSILFVFIGVLGIFIVGFELYNAYKKRHYKCVELETQLEINRQLTRVKQWKLQTEKFRIQRQIEANK